MDQAPSELFLATLCLHVQIALGPHSLKPSFNLNTLLLAGELPPKVEKGCVLSVTYCRYRLWTYMCVGSFDRYVCLFYFSCATEQKSKFSLVFSVVLGLLATHFCGVGVILQH